MKDKEILEQREKEYGDATESFTRISKFWGEYLGVEVKLQRAKLYLIRIVTVETI